MEAFDKYVKQFDFNENGIEYKYYHSYRVQKYAEEIAEKLDLGETDKKLASLIGLLHDIGRFYQLEEYHSYNDTTFDHGDHGVKVLFEKGLIKDYDISENYYDIVEKAIKNHNKYKIEDGLNERELFHAKLIRDADKIDILNAFSGIRVLELKESEDEISKEVEEEFFNKKTIQAKNIKNKNDRVLSMFAFIFDINFEVSLEIIEREDFINKLYEGLNNKERFKKYVDFIKKYIEEEKSKNVG